jgi:hypothetical protein
VEEELQHQTATSSSSSTTSRLKKQQQQQHVLTITRDREGHPVLRVNHETSQVTLSKEVRHLSWLGFRIPAAVRLLADRAAERYPHALALQAALRAWAQTRAVVGGGGRGGQMGVLLARQVQVGRCGLVCVCVCVCVLGLCVDLGDGGVGGRAVVIFHCNTRRSPPQTPHILPNPPNTHTHTLTHKHTTTHQALRDVAEEAFIIKSSSSSITGSTTNPPTIRWDNPKELGPWCARLTERAFALQEKAEECGVFLDRIDAALTALRRCPYEAPALRAGVGALQACVDEMSGAGFAHLDRFVEGVERRLRALLRTRLLAVLDAWVAAFAPGAGGKQQQRRRQGQGQQQDGQQQQQRRRRSMGCVHTGDRRPRRASLVGAEEGDGDEEEGLVTIVPRRCVHEIVLRDQALFLSPPLEASEARWVAQLHGWV